MKIIKKAISVLMLVAVLLTSFVSCTNEKKPNGDIAVTTDGITSGTSDTDNFSNHIKTIRYTPEREYGNIHRENEADTQRKVTVVAQIPDSWVSAKENESSRIYSEWNLDVADYMRRLEFSMLFHVSKDFVLDESVYVQEIGTAYIENPDMIESPDTFVPELGTTESGYPYVIYKRESGDSFRYLVYLRISDEYVFELEYVGDNAENRKQALKSLNSIECEVK